MAVCYATLSSTPEIGQNENMSLDLRNIKFIQYSELWSVIKHFFNHN